MNTQLLIDAIVRQTTVLIAQLATAGGIRAPLSHIANQVFVDLANQLKVQGVSRKVSADMFGMALRAYTRKLQRLSESSTERGESLWQSVLDYIDERPLATRADVLQRFCRDDPMTVRGILFDLAESGLVFASGNGDSTAYRTVAEDEARRAWARDDQPPDELLAVLIFRDGPFTRASLLERTGLAPIELDACLQRLVESQRVGIDSSGEVRGKRFVIRLDDPKGWEAAFLDHYHALVQTLCVRLRSEESSASRQNGGATYSFEVWPGHPYEDQVKGVLRGQRQVLSGMRERVDCYNAEHGIPPSHERVVCYIGQHVIEQEGSVSSDAERTKP